MKVAKKVRLMPTPEQEKLLWNSANHMRFAYNKSKAFSEKYYQLTGKTLSQVEMAKYLTRLRKRPKYEWLKTSSADIPKQATKDYHKARQKSFKDFGNGYHTRFKSKYDLEQGFYADYVKTKIKKKGVYISMIGTVRTSRQLPRTKKIGEPRIKFDGQYWWLTIVVEDDFQAQPLTQDILGVDVGLKDLLVSSNGMKFRNINKDAKVKELLRKKKKYQKQMSRRFVKGAKVQSNNYQKAKLEHLKVSRKITNIRDNHIHQATNALVKTKPMKIIVEDLNVKGMMQNKKLSKAISYQKWNFFMNCLKYKCERHGITFEKADRFYASSKTCSYCGSVYDHSIQKEGQWSLKIREWTCVHCNSAHDRDINAAINLSRWAEKTKKSA